eukprot:Awhi_evm1s2098
MLALSSILQGKTWEEALLCLDKEFDLQVDIDLKLLLFLVSYKHQTPLWKTGTEIQRRVLCESRGTVFAFDASDYTYTAVCVPFFKFWCFGENTEQDDLLNSNLTWGGEQSTNAIVEEKLDGNLLKLFWFQGQWRLASNGKLDVDSPRDKYGGRTNRHLFDEAASASGLDYSRLDRNFTYMFERVHPHCTIVVPYSEPRIVHIGSRDNRTLQELELNIGVGKPKRFTGFANMADCVRTAWETPWHKGEGFVVRDVSYNRAKLKSGSYLSLHHQITGLRGIDPLRFCIQTWLTNEESEILVYFPEYRAAFEETNHLIQTVVCAQVAERANARVKDCSKLFHAEKEAINAKERIKGLFFDPRSDPAKDNPCWPAMRELAKRETPILKENNGVFTPAQVVDMFRSDKKRVGTTIGRTQFTFSKLIKLLLQTHFELTGTNLEVPNGGYVDKV